LGGQLWFLQTVLLSDTEFHATFAEPMRNITGVEREVTDIWPYYETIPPAELLPFVIVDAHVEYVYRSGDERFDHVLISTDIDNVFLVLVINLREREIIGHHVLNLNEKYGLKTPKLD
jgi:hypothetical protein